VYDADQYDSGFNRFSVSIDEDKFSTALVIFSVSDQGDAIFCDPKKMLIHKVSTDINFLLNIFSTGSSQIGIRAASPSFFDYEDEEMQTFSFTVSLVLLYVK
jgi:hypothetical protein